MDSELFLIADPTFALFGPLGGAAGERACSIAKEVVRQAGADLARAIEAANEAVHAATVGDPKMRGAGCTAAAVRLSDARATIVWAGDVEVARLRRRTVAVLTWDHSLVNEYVRSGAIGAGDPKLAELPPNVIVRALGMASTVEVDSVDEATEPGDLLVMTSDSVRAALGSSLFETILVQSGGDARACVRELLAQAKAKGIVNVASALAIAIGRGEADPTRSAADAVAA